jgi:imidazolonepropionase
MGKKDNRKRLIGPFKQVLTMNSLPVKGAIPDDKMEVLPDAGLIINGETIEVAGRFDELKELAGEIDEIQGDWVAMPGLVDVHTHLCWAGKRANDYALRLAGKTYLEIAQQGGGIWSTVTATRQVAQEELVSLTSDRAARMLRQGTTTIEIKSGYGLNVDSELKMLQAIRKADHVSVADLVPTCLAHIKPKDFDGISLQYLEYLVTELLPVVKAENLARRADIYVDAEAFTRDDARYFLTAASEAGFDLVIHADQFTTGGVSLAVEMNACSADHLEASTDRDVHLIAKSHVVPVVLPGASLGLGTVFAPARRLLNEGASLVIASDWNPGSAPMGNLLMQAAILGVYEKLNMTETLSAITFRAAAALRLPDRGRLISGMLADIIAFPCSDYREILYNQGGLLPEKIWKRGRLISIK